MCLLNNALYLSHQYIRQALNNGGSAIDATCGNGHDTLFLSDLVQDTGTVYGFEIQPIALENTQKRLHEYARYCNTKLFLAGHETMDQHVFEKVRAVMFNFGFLPGSDHKIGTHEETDIPALLKALELLEEGGILTMCVYYGKDTGFSEKEALLNFAVSLDFKRYSVLQHEYVNQPNCPPLLICIEKLKSGAKQRRV